MVVRAVRANVVQSSLWPTTMTCAAPRAAFVMLPAELPSGEFVMRCLNCNLTHL